MESLVPCVFVLWYLIAVIMTNTNPKREKYTETIEEESQQSSHCTGICEVTLRFLVKNPCLHWALEWTGWRRMHVNKDENYVA